MGEKITAERNTQQLKKILETLYRQKTNFLDADYELMYKGIKSFIKGRSLLFLYTNFESHFSLQRALPILRKINNTHLLVVIFFENTELHAKANMDCHTMEDIYFKTIAQKFLLEKKLMVRELRKYGIQGILTKPQNLTVDTINKYLELKARGMI
jgi:uncharacterized protein (DUF58 family)